MLAGLICQFLRTKRTAKYFVLCVNKGKSVMQTSTEAGSTGNSNSLLADSRYNTNILITLQHNPYNSEKVLCMVSLEQPYPLKNSDIDVYRAFVHLY